MIVMIYVGMLIRENVFLDRAGKPGNF